MNYTPKKINLDLACEGYLTSPTGKLRYVYGLDALACAIADAEGRLYWAALDGSIAGMCILSSRSILLAEWCWDAENWWLKEVISHELGHLMVGRSETAVREWQRWNWPDATTLFAGEQIWPREMSEPYLKRVTL